MNKKLFKMNTYKVVISSFVLLAAPVAVSGKCKGAFKPPFWVNIGSTYS